MPVILRSLTIAASASAAFLLEAPTTFFRNVATRLQASRRCATLTRPLTMVACLADRKKSITSRLYEQGHISESIARAKNPLRRTILESELKVLNCHELKIEKKPTNSSGEPKVLYYLTNSLPHTHSGYTQRSAALIHALQGLKMQVHAVTRIGYPVSVGRIPKSEVEEIQGISYARILPCFLPFDKLARLRVAAESLRDIAAEERAAIIHTTTDFRNAIVASSAAKALGIPWIYEVRGELENTWASKQLAANPESRPEDAESYRLKRAQETYFAKAADHLLVLSQVSAQNFIARGVDPNSITVIPNSIDGTAFEFSLSQAECRKELNLPENKVLIGVISSLVEYEGIDDLLRAAAMLEPKFELVVVGDGTAKDGLEQLSHELGLESRVRFVGWQASETILKWYKALDVFTVTRKDLEVTRNVTPIKALQAHALRVPVVASDLPAIREVTGGHAVYSAPENPASIADAIVEALKLDTTPAWEFARSRTWAVTGRILAETYRKVLEQNGR